MSYRSPFALALLATATVLFAGAGWADPLPPMKSSGDTVSSSEFNGIVQALPKNNVVNYGARCDGATDDTSAIQAAITAATGAGGSKRVLFPSGRCRFTNLTITSAVTLEGTGRQTTFLDTGTSGSAISLGSSRFVTLRGFTVHQTASKQGKGIVASDAYDLVTEDLGVEGFQYGLYMDKALYHSHRNLYVEDVDYGVYYWGNSGTWNVDWYNNVITFVHGRIMSAAQIGIYVRGTTVSVNNVALEHCGIGLQLQGDPGGGVSSHSNVVMNAYLEGTNIGFKFEHARVHVGPVFYQGGGSSSAPFDTPFLVEDYSMVYLTDGEAIDYWKCRIRVHSNSHVWGNAIPGAALGSGACAGGYEVTGGGAFHAYTTSP